MADNTRENFLLIIQTLTSQAQESIDFLVPFTEASSKLPLGMRLNFIQAHKVIGIQNELLRKMAEDTLRIEDRLDEILAKHSK